MRARRTAKQAVAVALLALVASPWAGPALAHADDYVWDALPSVARDYVWDSAPSIAQDYVWDASPASANDYVWDALAASPDDYVWDRFSGGSTPPQGIQD
jgi:hypothetical protein